MKKGTVIGTLVGAVVGVTLGGNMANKKLVEKETKIDKFKQYYNMLNEWLRIKQEGKNLVKYFEENNYKEIAIYGMGEMGNRLLDDLKDSSVVVKYAIDKNAESTYAEIDVKKIDDELEKVDAIVVTAVFAYDDIVEDIQDKFLCPIVSLEDVVYGL